MDRRNYGNINNKDKYSLTKCLAQFLIYGTIQSLNFTIGSPLETIKILLQLQKINSTQIKNLITKQKGLWLWRGNLACTIQAFSTTLLGIFFRMQQNQSQRIMKSISSNKVSQKIMKLLKFFIEIIIMLLIVYPLKYCRVVLAKDALTQINNNKSKTSPQFNGVIDCIQKKATNHSFKQLYKGFVVTIIQQFLYNKLSQKLQNIIIDLTDRNQPQQLYPDQKQLKSRKLKLFLMSQFMHIVVSILLYPIDTLVKNMMADKQNLTVYSLITQKIGITGLYKGISIQILQKILKVILVLGYDYFKSRLLF